MSCMKNEHRELTVAGWGYRMNERGWLIYRHPHTGRRHTRLEATAIVETRVILRVHNTPQYFRTIFAIERGFVMPEDGNRMHFLLRWNAAPGRLSRRSSIECHEYLGGLPKYYQRRAACVS